MSLFVIFIVTLLLTGISLFSAIIVVVTVLMIIIDLGGLMYWWNIQLNAVSLVNLVMVSIIVSLKKSIIYEFILRVYSMYNYLHRLPEFLLNFVVI